MNICGKIRFQIIIHIALDTHFESVQIHTGCDVGRKIMCDICSGVFDPTHDVLEKFIMGGCDVFARGRLRKSGKISVSTEK